MDLLSSLLTIFLCLYIAIKMELVPCDFIPLNIPFLSCDENGMLAMKETTGVSGGAGFSGNETTSVAGGAGFPGNLENEIPEDRISEMGIISENPVNNEPQSSSRSSTARTRSDRPSWCNKMATTAMELFDEPKANAWLSDINRNFDIHGLLPMKWKGQSPRNILALHTLIPAKGLRVFNSNLDPVITIGPSKIEVVSEHVNKRVHFNHGLSIGDKATILIYSEHDGKTEFYVKENDKSGVVNDNVSWWHGVEKSYSSVPCHMWWHTTDSSSRPFDEIKAKI
jgi:hypothetical protein